MNIRCPHCHNPIHVVDPRLNEVVCPGCGSSFRVEGGSESMTTTSTIARRVGKFELMERVGLGAFGAVYRARDTELDRIVAVKIAHASLLESPQDRERFLREARAAAHLRHPSIVTVHEVREIDGVPTIISDFVEGVTLRDLLQIRRLTFRETAEFVAQVAEALDYAHSMGLVHRDIKPANIMVEYPQGVGFSGSFDPASGSSGGKRRTSGDAPTVAAGDSPASAPQRPRPILLDFGLALRDEAEVTMTVDGQIIGTPAYMSPEQAAGKSHYVDRRSDVYSLGVVLYELLCGEIPFRGSKVMMIHQVLREEPRQPRRLNDKIPRDLETICLKALSKSPARRYATARDLADDLRRWLHGEPITARRVSSAERLVRWCQRNPVVATLVATAATLLIAVAVISTVSAVRLKDLANRERNETKRANQEKTNAQRERTKALELANANATLAENEKSAREKSDLNADNALRQTKLAKRNLYNAHMNLAQNAWEDARVGAVLDLLERWRPRGQLAESDPNSRPTTAGNRAADDDLRGFEWHYWDRLCHSSLLDLKGHRGGVASVVFSPDGKRLASAGDDWTVKVWDATSGQETLTLKGHTGGVTSVAYSPDGKRLASASRYFSTPGDVRVWDAASGEELLTLKGHNGGVWSVAFSPDGKWLASASEDQTVKVWDSISGQETLTLKGHTGNVTSVVFSADGKRLASASGDDTVKVWDATSGQESLTLKGHTGNVWSVAFSADGKRLASADGEGSVKVWDAASGAESLTLKGHTDGVMSVAFSAEGYRLASASDDQTLKVWFLPSGREMLTLKGHTSRVTSVAFSPDGNRLASASLDGTVKVWDATNYQEALTLRGHGGYNNFVAFSADGKRLASASDDQMVKVWNATSGQETLTLKGHTGGVTSVAFSPDGKRLASAAKVYSIPPTPGELKLWDATSGQETLTLKGHIGQVWSVTFSPNGQRLASASDDRTVKVWDVTSGEVLLTLKGHADSVTSVAFSADGKRLASASNDRTVKLWDATSDQETLTLKGHVSGVKSVAFSADGKRLASASEDQTVKVWDSMSGEVLLTLKGHTSGVTSVAFSADGTRLASASHDETVKLWDVTSGQEMLTLKGRTSHFMSVMFNADGKRLASASWDTTVKVWDARPWTPELKAEQQAVSLIRSLFRKGLPKENVLKAIADDQTITDLVRQSATELAGPFADNLERSKTP